MKIEPKIAAAVLAVAAVLVGCSGSGEQGPAKEETGGLAVTTPVSTSTVDPAACKAAMSTSTTGPAQWSTDPSTRPEACKGMDDAEFNKLAAEWYDEFQKEATGG